MKANIRALTHSAILAALAVVLLFISAIVPSGRLALAAVAGLAALLALLAFGGKWALGVYVVSTALGLLLVPSKGSAILYAVFLGYYPALKCIIERIRSCAAQWTVKLASFNAILIAMFLLARAILTDALSALPQSVPLWLLWIGMNVVFVVYDLGLKGLIRIYVRRFTGKRNGVG